MATAKDAEKLALALPQTSVGLKWNRECFLVADKFFARIRGENESDPGVLVVRCDPAERPFMLAGEPEKFFVTPHYENHAYVLVRLAKVDRTELRELLIEAWLRAAPKRLAKEHADALLSR